MYCILQLLFISKLKQLTDKTNGMPQDAIKIA